MLRKRRLRILLPSLLLVVSLIGFGHGLSHGQQLAAPPQRQVNVVALNLYAPIAVTEVLSLGNAYVLPRGPNQSVSFQDANPEWIGDAALVVKNQSPKDIVAMRRGLRWQRGSRIPGDLTGLFGSMRDSFQLTPFN